MKPRCLILLVLLIALTLPGVAAAQRRGRHVRVERDRAGQAFAPDRVESQLARTRAMLDGSRAALEACPRPRALELWRTAEDMQRRADDAFRSGRSLAALQLTLGARDRAERARRMCDVRDEPVESAEQAVRRTDGLIAAARARLGEHAPASSRALLVRAAEKQSRARQELRERRADSAMRTTLVARALAYRAARQAE